MNDPQYVWDRRRGNDLPREYALCTERDIVGELERIERLKTKWNDKWWASVVEADLMRYLVERAASRGDNLAQKAIST